MTKLIYSIKIKTFQDKNTGQWIMYSKKFEISSYGKTIEQANDMFEEIVTDILLSTKPKKSNKG